MSNAGYMVYAANRCIEYKLQLADRKETSAAFARMAGRSNLKVVLYTPVFICRVILS